jgi:hypothetical protein
MSYEIPGTCFRMFARHMRQLKGPLLIGLLTSPVFLRDFHLIKIYSSPQAFSLLIPLEIYAGFPISLSVP